MAVPEIARAQRGAVRVVCARLIPDSDLPPPEPPPLPEAPPRRAWGFWASLAFGLLAMGAMVLVQTIVVGIFLGIEIAKTPGGGEPQIEAIMERLLSDPQMLAVSVLASVPLALGALWVAILLRKDWRFGEYLAVRRFRAAQFFIWAAALALVLIGGEQLLEWQGDTSGEEFMLDLLKSGNSLGLLIVALTLGAPLGEELLFRGFMFRGMAASPAGWGLAILVPNVFWVSLHVQYAWPTLAVLFAMGIVLGLARQFSGSVVLPIVLHLLSNAISTFTAMSMAE